jgi:glycosyltransferase involved in cell wall biosynthesis
MRVLIVTNLYPTPDEPSFGTFVKSQVDELRAAGVELEILFINGRKRKWNYLLGVLRLWWHLLRHKYDLIHAHYIFAGVIARLQWSYPVVVTHHGIEVVHDTWVAKLVRFTHPWFDRVIVVSQPMKEKLNDPAIHLIPCGINLKQMRPMPQAEARAHLGLPQDKKLILWAGEHWREEKRFYIVEQAVALLQKELPEAELVLVSGQPHTVIPFYMNGCDVLALTSTYEGSPMVIKEAMACNLPLVSTDVGDVAEVIAGVEGCYLCEATPEDVAQKLRQALAWGQRTKGRDKIEHLSAERAAQKVIALYHELVDPHPLSQGERGEESLPAPRGRGEGEEQKRLKLLVVLGDGGHTTEMLKLVELLGSNYAYSYMLADTDKISEGKIKFQGPVYRVPPPSKKHHRSWLNFWRVFGPAFAELRVLRQVRPQAILSTGAGIAVPIAAWGRLTGVKVIHVETGSRIYSMSLTGKLMYRLAHLFFVQWETLQKDYPKAIYAGRLL